jgi:putative heme iron utilization protein
MAAHPLHFVFFLLSTEISSVLVLALLHRRFEGRQLIYTLKSQQEGTCILHIYIYRYDRNGTPICGIL